MKEGLSSVGDQIGVGCSQLGLTVNRAGEDLKLGLKEGLVGLGIAAAALLGMAFVFGRLLSAGPHLVSGWSDVFGPFILLCLILIGFVWFLRLFIMR